MCELFAMSSRGPATVTLSLSILAEHGGKTSKHKDGWGIAFYDEKDARIIKDTASASQSQWVQFVGKGVEFADGLAWWVLRLCNPAGQILANGVAGKPRSSRNLPDRQLVPTMPSPDYTQ